jgi:RNA polymerase sigma-70 factor (ECF subfamily)
VSFEREVVAHAPRLKSFIRRRVSSCADAADLTQETLLKAFRQRGTLRSRDRLNAWLHRIARTTIIDHYRQRRPQAEWTDQAGPAEEARISQVTAAVAAAARCYLETLPDEYQSAVRLADFEGVPHADVAKKLGISLTAAKSRIRRGKQRIRELMEECCHLKFDRQGRVMDYERRDGRPCRLD